MRKLIAITLAILLLWSCNREELNTFENTHNNNGDTIKTALTVTDNMLLFSDESSSKTLIIESNSKWAITDIPQWLTASPMQGSDTTTITISTKKNTSNEARNVKLTIAAGELIKRIDIWQEKEQKIETIAVLQAGTLMQLLKQNNLGSAVFLKVTGNINNTDLIELRRYNRLLSLDLKDVSIVEGERHTGSKWVVSPANCIDDTAFINFSQLETIILPQNITSIGKQAFASCTNLKEVTMQASTLLVGEEAFINCSSLQTMALPSSVTDVKRRAFANCTALQNITLSKKMEAIREESFANCYSLKSFPYTAAIRIIESRAFANCTSLIYMNLVVPNGKIGEEAFINCSSLQTISLPYYQGEEWLENAFPSIGARAFFGCTRLRQINSISYTPPSIGKAWSENACFDSEYIEVCTLKVATNAASNYKEDENWGSYNFKVVSID